MQMSTMEYASLCWLAGIGPHEIPANESDKGAIISMYLHLENRYKTAHRLLYQTKEDPHG